MSFIHQFITNPSSLQNDASFLASCLTLAAHILSWDFEESQSTSEGLLFSRSSSSGDSTLRPPSHYRDIFINSHDILLCFFKVALSSTSGLTNDEAFISLLLETAFRNG